MPGHPNNNLFSRRTDYGGEKTLTVTQVRSGIGNKPKALGTLRALGLGRIGKKNVLPDRPEIRGMLARVPHLITVVDESTPSDTNERRADMRVDELAPAPGATKSKKRVGRGIGGKGGKTAGRGTKGQYARNTVARGFEGGQTGLKQRVPKLKGFNNPFRVEYSPVNLDQLAGARRRQSVDPESLVASGLVRKGTFVKILGRGELKAAVSVSAHAVSKAAESAITDAGGSVTLIPLPVQVRPPARQGQPVRQPLNRSRSADDRRRACRPATPNIRIHIPS